MERVGGSGVGEARGEAARAPVAAAGVVKGRSCKGCLFYSSVLRSKARGPVCAGVTRAIPQATPYSSHMDPSYAIARLQKLLETDDFEVDVGSQVGKANCVRSTSYHEILMSVSSMLDRLSRCSSVPDRMVGEIELEAIQEGRNLSNFKYACVGYSIYLDDKEKSMGKGEKQAQLPICVGVELLADRGSTKAPAHLKKEATQAHRNKPGKAGDDFLTKFQRNASIVANGVARNLNKVGTYVKDRVDDIMYPYRKGPK